MDLRAVAAGSAQDLPFRTGAKHLPCADHQYMLLKHDKKNRLQLQRLFCQFKLFVEAKLRRLTRLPRVG